MAKEHVNITPERWSRIEEVFQLLLDLPPVERMSYLDQVSAGDEDLALETLSLLSAYDEAGEFIEVSALSKHGGAIFSDTAFDLSERLLGHYQVLRLISAGGMGRVYLAHDKRLDRQVALKLLPSFYVSDPER